MRGIGQEAAHAQFGLLGLAFGTLQRVQHLVEGGRGAAQVGARRSGPQASAAGPVPNAPGQLGHPGQWPHGPVDQDEQQPSGDFQSWPVPANSSIRRSSDRVRSRSPSLVCRVSVPVENLTVAVSCPSLSR